MFDIKHFRCNPLWIRLIEKSICFYVTLQFHLQKRMDCLASCLESCLFVQSRHHDVLIRVLEMLNLIWFHKPPSQSYLNVTCDLWVIPASLWYTLTHSLVIGVFEWWSALVSVFAAAGKHRVPGSSLSLSLSLSLSFCLKLSQDFSGSEPSA